MPSCKLLISISVSGPGGPAITDWAYKLIGFQLQGHKSDNNLTLACVIDSVTGLHSKLAVTLQRAVSAV